MTQILKHTPPNHFDKSGLEALFNNAEFLGPNYPREGLMGYFSCGGEICGLTDAPKHIAVTFWDNNSDQARPPEQMHIICTENKENPSLAVKEYFDSSDATRAIFGVFAVCRVNEDKTAIPIG